MKMDNNESERIVIAKPVASRPTYSTFRSFSELLAGAINESPPNISSQSGVAPIKPKTVRVRPTINHSAAAVFSSEAGISGIAATSKLADTVTNSDAKPTIVYKPVAKPVSKTTASLLANMGNVNVSREATQPPQADDHHSARDKLNTKSKKSLNVHQSVANCAETDQTSQPSKSAALDTEEDQKLAGGANGDRPSYDGYNWRKYGQKQVKGSEYPRSYYKCTHPNCPVKKKVERSFDGQIAEIVYKGEHNHSKPQPAKRSSSGTVGLGPVSDGAGQDSHQPLWSSQLGERNSREENQNDMGLLANSAYGKRPLINNAPATEALGTAGGTSDNSCAISVEGDGSKGGETGNDEPRSKRRKNEDQSSEAGARGASPQEPCTIKPNATDPEILGDGFRWRKYGQKVVKGNPHPRSYYRCTSLKCNVRKYVERALDNPKSFITTYEGKHNHEMPVKGTHPANSESEHQAIQ